MTAQVLLDNVLLPADSARLPATSEGFLYGHGLFETIKVLAGRPLFTADHHARLLGSAGALGLAYDIALDLWEKRLATVISANALVEGSAKVVIFNAGTDRPAGELISTRAGLYPAATYDRGFRLKTTLEYARASAITGHKTLNYLANSLARRAALAAGCDEALFTAADGSVIEGAATNLFLVENGIAITPPLASGCLPGTARARVLKLLGADRAREDVITAARLARAEEVFVTNALLGVMPVSRIDDRDHGLLKDGFTATLMNSYRAGELAHD